MAGSSIHPANVQECINKTADTIVQASLAGAVGYLCARAFVIVKPLHAAAFSAIASVVFKFASPLFERLFNGEGANNAAKAVGWAVSVAVGVGASASLATLAGFSISFKTALLLSATVVAVEAITVVGLALVAAACVN